eukprot:gb/GECH01004858.1/.p1 GENE.gb/GECH01004858.1/~~gb/GECH01004858.1/.p1  ORF type:complete len:430 (+),score=90.79 gb/GECH01004858.1/:1-1290(+)
MLLRIPSFVSHDHHRYHHHRFPCVSYTSIRSLSLSSSSHHISSVYSSLLSHVTSCLSQASSPSPSLSSGSRQPSIPQPRWEAAVMLSAATAVPLSHLLRLPSSSSSSSSNLPTIDHRIRTRFQTMIDRRCRAEPLQYVIGEWDFMKYTFRLSPQVLVPRPETEIMVERALRYVRETGRERRREDDIRILECGVGSGAVLTSVVALLKEEEGRGPKPIHGVGVDISEGALRVAASNARRILLGEEEGEKRDATDDNGNGVDDPSMPPFSIRDEHGNRITLSTGDMMDNGRDGLLGHRTVTEHTPYHIIMANPPYIPSAHLNTPHIQPEVSHEPRLALDGGDDGLNFYRALAPVLASLLPSPSTHECTSSDDPQLGESPPHTVSGIGLLEVGAGQAGTVSDIMKEYGNLETMETIPDLSGIERCVVIRRNC